MRGIVHAWLRTTASLRWGVIALLLAVGMSVVGCWVCGLPEGYVRSAVWGELLYLSNMVPIEDGVTDPDLTDPQRFPWREGDL